MRIVDFMRNNVSKFLPFSLRSRRVNKNINYLKGNKNGTTVKDCTV